jgi:hypothetical protein
MTPEASSALRVTKFIETIGSFFVVLLKSDLYVQQTHLWSDPRYPYHFIVGKKVEIYECCLNWLLYKSYALGVTKILNVCGPW